jgi:GT2 family glycosyltransferase
MNPVLLLAHNNLNLTRRCVASIRAQDVPTKIYLLDNGSTDGTYEWASEEEKEEINYTRFPQNRGVSFGWNHILGWLFDKPAIAEHCLCIGTDTIIPPWFFRVLLTYLSDAVPFITGVAVDDYDLAMNPDAIPEPLTPCPDFSGFLISRKCWEVVGRFDESMKHYSSDQDYHIRAWRKGVPLYKVNVRFYHEISSTLKFAEPMDRYEIQMQADKDRARLREKWGAPAGGPAYEALFSSETFGCEKEDHEEDHEKANA